MEYRQNLLPSSSGDLTAPALGDDMAESVTQLLVEAEQTGGDAWNRIYGLIYQDLHRIARSQIRQQMNPGLSPTSLISETWLKLVRSQISASSRPHLVSLIARAMRFVLVDEVRRALASKRGGRQVAERLSSIREPAAEDDRLEEVLALDKALESLAEISPRLTRVVELRYYGGLEETEIAELLGVTSRTVRRDWRKARAFLQCHLAGIQDTPAALWEGCGETAPLTSEASR
ncbi:ECF-type sigma factor [Luteimonas suaedae]|uniref:ECF-type sigma factor n=1 Tax=Luteimonas suaedae TaxID=2605430 RepID=UPI0011ED1691|nr:ECF-type sigma factor [Luteimonas suaedae]